jgi:hypothetical protein
MGPDLGAENGLRARAAFRVCQAMSIAMTVALPAPVASLKAMRRRSGFASAFRARRRLDLPRIKAVGHGPLLYCALYMKHSLNTGVDKDSVALQLNSLT